MSGGQDRGPWWALLQRALLCFTLGGAQAESEQWQSVCWNSPITPVRGQTLREGALCPTLEQAYSRANGSLQSVWSFLQNILAAQEVCV